MKNLKLLGLAALIITASMAFAGGASATTVTTTTGGAAATPTIHLVNENGHFTMKNPMATIACNATFEASVAAHGAETTADITIANLWFSTCTNSWHFTTEKAGSLVIHWTNGHSGTVTWTGARILTTRFNVPCIYETQESHFGTLTGGNPATLKVEGSMTLAEGSSLLCGSGNVQWEGSLVTTSALYVAP